MSGLGNDETRRTNGQHIIVPNNYINPGFFNPSPAAASSIMQGQTPQNTIPIVAHIIGAHSGMPIEPTTKLLKMIQVTGQPCVEYWQTEIGTVGVCSADAMDEYTAFIINNINKLKDFQYNSTNYMDLFHKLNILCEAKSRQSNMPDLTDDTDNELNDLETLIDKIIERIDDDKEFSFIKNIKYGKYSDVSDISILTDDEKEQILVAAKGLNENLLAIKTFTSNDSIGTFTYYPVGSWKYDVSFMPQNDLRPDARDLHGNVFNSMNWRDWLTIIGNVPSTRQLVKDPIVTQIETSNMNYDTGISTTTFYETLGGPWAVGQNTRSGALQQGYLESQMRPYLQNTYVCNIYFGCRVIVKVDARGVFEDEETKALNVKTIIARSEPALKTLNDTLPANFQPIKITLEESIARVRNLRSDTNQSLQNELDRLTNKKQYFRLIKILDKLTRYDNNFLNNVRKTIIRGGKPKPKKPKSTKSKKFQRRSKRRNNRRTYKKKARKTKRRRRY